MPRTYFGEITISGDAEVTTGDVTTGEPPSHHGLRNRSNLGSVYNHIEYKKNFTGIGHTGTTGPSNGSRFDKVYIAAEAEITAKIQIGDFANVEAKMRHDEKTRRLQAEAREFVRKRKILEAAQKIKDEEEAEEYMRARS